MKRKEKAPASAATHAEAENELLGGTSKSSGSIIPYYRHLMQE